MKTYRVIGYCDSERTKQDGWTPPQKLVTGASENYAINLVKQWIKNHPKRYDEYEILEEENRPGYIRSILRVKYIARRIFDLKETKNWQLLEVIEDIESPE